MYLVAIITTEMIMASLKTKIVQALLVLFIQPLTMFLAASCSTTVTTLNSESSQLAEYCSINQDTPPSQSQQLISGVTPLPLSNADAVTSEFANGDRRSGKPVGITRGKHTSRNC
jgi:hypothetical protein